MDAWIGVDLDGTLAHYDKWRGLTHIGEFIPEMVRKIKVVLQEGHIVKIFTARVCEPDRPGFDEFMIELNSRTLAHFGKVLEVTNIKDFGMVELWDDRAVTVEHNTGRFLAPSTRDFGVALNEEAQRADAMEKQK